MHATSESPRPLTILLRGAHGCCPNCGGKTLFERGRFFQTVRHCPACGLPVDRGGGFFLGPMCLFVAFGIIAPLILLGILGLVPLSMAVILSAGGALLLPVLLYRFSWGLWIAGFYALSPHLLAARGRETFDDAEY